MRKRAFNTAVANVRYVPYSYEKLYYSLIPVSVSSKNIGGNAKITKVYGDSVVENQLFPISTRATTTYDNITCTNNNDGSFTVNGTNSASGTSGYLNYNLFTNANEGSLIANHKYLLSLVGNKDSNLFIRDTDNASQTGATAIIYTVTNATTFASAFRIRATASVTITNETFYPILIDLTQMFPFDTPTSLSDVRVQALLNRGYIAYNTGEIKSVDIGEFSSEPYNLFDEELEQGRWDGDGTNRPEDTTAYRSKNYIKVICGQKYTLDASKESNAINRVFVTEYDVNYNFIQRSLGDSNSKVSDFTLTNNTHYIKFYCKSDNTLAIPTNPQICFHRTGTRTGYAPYQALTPLSFKAQLSGADTSKDTFEITSNGYVFVKNNGSYTFTGNESFVDWSGSGISLTIALPNLKSAETINSVANIMWGLGQPTYLNDINSSSPEYTIAVNLSGRLYIATTKTSSQLASALTGKTIQYQLATPQTITIPKKHLAWVDLGSLNWIYYSSQVGKERFYATLNGGKIVADNVVANIYCSKYKTDTWNNVANHTQDKLCGISNVGGNCAIFVNDSAYTDATTFKNSLQGQYLFYETASEVADIMNMLPIEAGGTLTSNSNVLPKINTLLRVKDIDNHFGNYLLISSDGHIIVDVNDDYIITTESV